MRSEAQPGPARPGLSPAPPAGRSGGSAAPGGRGPGGSEPPSPAHPAASAAPGPATRNPRPPPPLPPPAAAVRAGSRQVSAALRAASPAAGCARRRLRGQRSRHPGRIGAHRPLRRLSPWSDGWRATPLAAPALRMACKPSDVGRG